MGIRGSTWLAVGGFIAGLLLSVGPAQAQVPNFTGVEITSGFIPTAINASGEMAGYADFAGQVHAARLSNGVVTDLGVLPGGDQSQATGINASGQIVGWSKLAGGLTHAFLYSGGVMLDLGTLPGGANSRAAAINDAGQVAGTSDTLQPNTSFPRPDHAFRYSGGVMTDLGNISATANFANFSEAKGINASGVVVGWSVTDAFETHAFRTSGGAMVDLGTLGGSESRATGINDAGVVSGWSLTNGDAAKHAFKYAASMADLGTLAGNNNSSAYAINKDGLTVGDSTFSATPAFIHSSGSGMVKLDTLVGGPGWSLSRAPAINGNAQVVAYGTNASVLFATYFLLTPVPVAPAYGGQPANQTVSAGAVANFSVTVSGLPTPTVQWQQSTDGGSNWSNLANGAGVSGATTTTLSITTSFAMNGYRYRAVASNSAGSVNSASALLTVNPSPALSVADVSVTEGNAGTKLATFTISLSPVAAGPVSFDVGTGVGTAIPGDDYVAQSQPGQVIPAGQSSANFSVVVNGDTQVEGHETFTVNLSNVSGALVSRGQALGTISNDDVAALSIGNASVVEGNAGTSTLRFVVSLPVAMPTAVSFDVATANGTAQAGSDYVARNQAGRVLDAGRTQAVFEVQVNGDATLEPDETLTATLSNIVGAAAGTTVATGTIVNDDGGALVGVSIAQVQGEGTVSPLLGREVSTEGIVTARVRDGVWLQSPDAARDGSEDSSEGLFVATDPGGLAVGDRLRVGGVVREAADAPGDATLTLLDAHAVAVLGHREPLPRPVVLDARSPPTALESREGMRVTAPRLVVVAPDAGRVDAQGQVRGDGRFHVVGAGIARPFANGAGPAGGGSLRVVSDAQLGAAPRSADVGDRIAGMVGVLGQGGLGHELLPDPGAFGAVELGARPRAARAPREGEQLLGWFDLHDAALDADAGAGLASAWPVRQAKIAAALREYARSPALVVFTGLRDGQALGALARALDAGPDDRHAPGSVAVPGYRALGGDAVGVLLRGRQVDVLATERLMARGTGQAGVPAELFDARPLLLHLRISSPGRGDRPLALLVVPTSARGGPAPRHAPAAAQALQAARAQWLAATTSDFARRHPAEPLMVFTDLDVAEFRAAGGDLLALGGRLEAAERYDATRDGDAILLGQVLVNSTFLAAWPGAQPGVARTNADFSADNRPDAGVPMGFADRDPQVVYLPGD